MRRMFSEKQIQELVKNTPKGIESLVDQNGNPRFIEGDITMEEIEGITQTYGKWSLSATHLMGVIAGTIANTTALTSGQTLATIEIPDWIYNKIIPIYSSIVVYISQNVYSDTGTTQAISYYFDKSNDKLLLKHAGSFTANTKRNFRFILDLLIDSD